MFTLYTHSFSFLCNFITLCNKQTFYHITYVMYNIITFLERRGGGRDKVENTGKDVSEGTQIYILIVNYGCALG